MSLQIKISEADDIDLTKYCILQQKSFAAVFAGNRMDNSYLDPAFFKWKYRTPAGNARIAFVEEENTMIASVAMYPVYISIKGVKLKSWHFVEAAVLPEARGKGFFQRCMTLLIDSLAKDEIIYVFPNSSSINGTLKKGFRRIEQSAFYVRIFSAVFRKKAVTPYVSHLFSEEQDKYAHALSCKHDVVIFRDAAYMNWRYKQHPHFFYYTFSPVVDGRVMGNVVARPILVKGVKLLLIMEMHSLKSEVQKEMVSFLKRVAAKENCFIAGMFSGESGKPSLSATGMMRTPSFVVPKHHILMAYENESSFNMGSLNWFSQTGDWDAF